MKYTGRTCKLVSLIFNINIKLTPRMYNVGKRDFSEKQIKCMWVCCIQLLEHLSCCSQLGCHSFTFSDINIPQWTPGLHHEQSAVSKQRVTKVTEVTEVTEVRQRPLCVSFTNSDRMSQRKNTCITLNSLQRANSWTTSYSTILEENFSTFQQSQLTF